MEWREMEEEGEVRGGVVYVDACFARAHNEGTVVMPEFYLMTNADGIVDSGCFRSD